MFSITHIEFFKFAAAGVLVVLAVSDMPSRAEEAKPSPCIEDTMIVFDASGSMAGNVDQGIATIKPRIDEVRSALGKVLPSVTRFRRVGLITYGPGPYNQCNVELDLKPTPKATELIMRVVNALTPAGRTPLTSAVEEAANVLDFRHKPGTIVVLTDGEETCGRSPCDLGKELHAAALQLTVHVIGYRTKNFSWTGEQSILDAKCLAEQNNGLYVTAETEDELVAAFQKTLDCPMISQRAFPVSAYVGNVFALSVTRSRVRDATNLGEVLWGQPNLHSPENGGVSDHVRR
jgi:Ca-activated chloride channel family protein